MGLLTAMDDLDHLLTVIEANDRRYAERFAAQERAIAVAETTSEKWQANANEWRGSLSDRDARFATKEETSLQFRAINDRLTKLEIAYAESSGNQQGWKTGWAILVAFVGIAVAIVALWLRSS